MPRQARAWVFTLNNYTAEDQQRLQDLQQEGSLQYLIYGREVGQEGTPHLQGYLELPRKKTLGGLKRLLGNNSFHLEQRRGSQTQAEDYCKKDGDFVALGDKMQQGGRGDLLALRDRLRGGDTLRELAEDDGSFEMVIRYRRGLQWYAEGLSPPRTWKSHVVLFTGPTGTGKTGRVHYRTRDSDLFTHPGGAWFDGYHGQDNVLFDDYHGDIDYRLLLRLLDRYEMSVPVKGSFANWCPRKIYITSNGEPEDWYPERPHVDELVRRIDERIVVPVGALNPWDVAPVDHNEPIPLD